MNAEIVWRLLLSLDEDDIQEDVAKSHEAESNKQHEDFVKEAREVARQLKEQQGWMEAVARRMEERERELAEVARRLTGQDHLAAAGEQLARRSEELAAAGRQITGQDQLEKAAEVFSKKRRKK